MCEILKNSGIFIMIAMPIAVILAAFMPYLWRRFIKTPPNCPQDYTPMIFAGYYRDAIPAIPMYKCGICGMEAIGPD